MRATRTIRTFLFLFIGMLTMTMSCNGTLSKAVADSTKTDTDTDSVVSIVESTDTLDKIANEAERCLYAIYYDKRMLDNPNVGFSYAPAMRAKFRELEITKGVNSPYTKSLASRLAELDKVATQAMENTGDLFGFDCDILWDSQGDIDNFNIEVTGSEVKDADHVVLKTKFTNMSTKNKVYRMVRENGTFKIDDMDNLRKQIQTEINSCRPYLKRSDVVCDTATTGEMK